MKKVVLFVIAALWGGILFAQNAKVSGTVTDSDGAPLPGVAVLVEGTGIGTVTNSKGQYSMTIQKDDHTLVFSCIGMQNQSVPVIGRAVIDVKMVEDAIGLSQSVVTATGLTRSQKALGYASTTVTSDDIMKGHSADAPFRFERKNCRCADFICRRNRNFPESHRQGLFFYVRKQCPTLCN